LGPAAVGAVDRTSLAMPSLKTPLLAASAAALSLALGACDTMDSNAAPATAAQAEVSNAGNLNSNGSAQPGGAGTSPTGGNTNPGTSGTVSNTPGPGPQ
jgi:hypothetical protein